MSVADYPNLIALQRARNLLLAIVLLVFFINAGFASVWTQRGADIDGEAMLDQSGESIALSADGTVVAIGATENDGNGDRSGHARIFEFDSGSGAWTQRGSDIDGEAVLDRSGGSVSLSADGNVAVIGAWGNDDNGDRSGHARIFEYDSGSGAWTQRGADIDGEAVEDLSGL